MRFTRHSCVFACLLIVVAVGSMASATPRDEIRRDVEALAGRIGERNVFTPKRLEAAAKYLEGRWIEQGYTPRRQTYDANGVSVSNLVVEKKGAGAGPI